MVNKGRLFSVYYVVPGVFPRRTIFKIKVNKGRKKMDLSPEFLETIRPKTKKGHSDKYSYNLYKYLLDKPYRSKVYCGVDPYVGGKHKVYFLGFYDNDSNGWFYGAKLMSILCGRDTMYAYPPNVAKDFSVEKNFYDEYARIGRCLWDPDHEGWMQDDKERLTYSEDGNTRVCNWCGSVQAKEVKQVTENVETWKTIPLFS